MTLCSPEAFLLFLPLAPMLFPALLNGATLCRNGFFLFPAVRVPLSGWYTSRVFADSFSLLPGPAPGHPCGNPQGSRRGSEAPAARRAPLGEAGQKKWNAETIQKYFSIKNPSSFGFTLRLCASIAAFVCIFFYYQNDIGKWLTFPDTPSYLGNNYLSNPWGSQRTPGVAMYWQLIGAKGELREAFQKFPNADDFNKLGKQDEKIYSLGKKVALCNLLLLGLSFSLLCFALSTFIHPLVSLIFILVSMYFGAIPLPKYLLADLPACSLTVVFVALGILYAKYRKNVFLFLLSCCAILACLVKPGMFFLALVAGCMLGYELLLSIRTRNLKNALASLCTGAFLTAGTLSWPFLLYLHSGLLVPSQLSATTKTMFAIYLLQEGDDELFTDPKLKALVADLILHKPEADAEINKRVYRNKRNLPSKASIYVNSVNYYGWQYFFDSCKRNGYNRMSNIEYARLAKEMSAPIIRKHFGEYMKTVGRSFLSAFGAYEDIQIGIWWRRHLGPKSLGLFIACYLFIACAFVLGVQDLQYTIVLLAVIHITSVIFTSIGHAVLGRYLGITEWSFLLALEVALWSVILRILHSLPRSRPLRA